MTNAPQVDISLLNHASLLIEAGNIRLLTDPWYSGTAFEDGWGLRYDNPVALETAATATHLWISHFHEDHLHTPTLRELAERNPDIVFLANQSYNFDMMGAARRLGFKTVVALPERSRFDLDPGISVTRYPTTGIDNMLLMRGRGWSLLNFNDCVISDLTARLLAKKIGPIDLFATNFNHAGKLFRRKPIEDGTIKQILADDFHRTYEPFRPKFVIPFASHHFYRAPESIKQNRSMLMVDELVQGGSSTVVPLKVGGHMTYLPAENVVNLNEPGPIGITQRAMLQRPESISFEDLQTAAFGYQKKIRRGFGILARMLPPIRIRLLDLDRLATLDLRRGLVEAEPGRSADIVCQSSALNSWMTKIYGTDAFAVGAHFRIVSMRKTRLILYIATGLLTENKLDPRSLLSMLASKSGLKFLSNRREEILGILVSRKVYPDYHKD
jgi:UDP-MurNAc hydroxylase